MKTFHLHIGGRVQGVGFRPFVYLLAQKADLAGWVLNGLNGVHIEVSGDENKIDTFIKNLKSQLPEKAIISTFDIREIDYQPFSTFQIRKSEATGPAGLLISPDFALCDHCRKELNNPKNKRYRYPFITCTQCGPRYSILKGLPYDREYTTMHAFETCPACEAEYHQLTNKRFYSQTNSCPDCPVTLTLHDTKNHTTTTDQEDAISMVSLAILEGKTVAVKGIGGYLLLTDATQTTGIKTLRQRKRRPYKPFALMYPSLEAVMKDLEVSHAEADILTSAESPVVLLKTQSHPKNNLPWDEIAYGLNRAGVMLPYAPLFELILQAVERPVIATSANLTDHPIIYEDEDALESLYPVADLILSHDREIVVPQDDSVVKCTAGGKRIFLRRSRGFAPVIFNDVLAQKGERLLAMGADLKGAFGIVEGSNTLISQYLGNLESWESQRSYEHTMKHLMELIQSTPEHLLIDKHPGYFTHQMGKEYATQHLIDYSECQHHEAHFAAVLAENHLLNEKAPVLGFIWDGTGLGDDGHIWGGEVFKYKDRKMDRVNHLATTQHILGDKFSKEPRLAALSFADGKIKKHLRQKFTDQEWQFFNHELTSTQLLTSSMGRLFDAMASLLYVCDINHYEGQAAMMLEALAEQYFTTCPIIPTDEQWKVSVHLKGQNLLFQALQDAERGLSAAHVAAKFHWALIDWIEKNAVAFESKHLAFSGGGFQNSVLTDLIESRLSKRFILYFHQELPPNDECIALGQMALFQMSQEKKPYAFSHYKKTMSCV